MGSVELTFSLRSARGSKCPVINQPHSFTKMIAEIEFIPLPADQNLFEENVQYIVLDREQNFHIARWNGDMFLIDGAEVDADNDEAEDVDIVMIGLLPVFELPESI